LCLGTTTELCKATNGEKIIRFQTKGKRVHKHRNFAGDGSTAIRWNTVSLLPQPDTGQGGKARRRKGIGPAGPSSSEKMWEGDGLQKVSGPGGGREPHQPGLCLRERARGNVQNAAKLTGF